MVKKFIGNNFILILIIIFAIGIRIYGIYPGYTADHPDEPASYLTATRMLYDHLRPNRIDYPAGVPLSHLIFYVIFFIPTQLVKLLFVDPKFISDIQSLIKGFDFSNSPIFGPRLIYALYWSRYIAAAFGVGSVLLLYFCGKKLFNKNVGLIAAFLLTFNYRHVLGSHFALPDIHGAFFALLSLYTSILLLEKNTRKRYILAGIAVSLFLSIKFQIFALGPYLFSHLAWVVKKKDWKFFFNKNFIISTTIVVLVFLLVNPYLLSDLGAFKKRTDYTMLVYQAGIFRFQLYPYFNLYHWGIGELPSLAAITGLFLMLRLNFKKFMMLFSFVFLVFFMMTYYSIGGVFPRNFLPLIPFLLLYAGFCIDILYKQLLKINRIVALVGIAVILIFINASPMKNSVILSYNYAKPWNVTLLGSWLKDNIPSAAVIRKYPINLDYQDKLELQNKNIKILEWDPKEDPNSLSEFQEEGTQFAILNTYQFQSHTYWWRIWDDNKMFLKYNNIPFDYIQNTFHGLVLKELLSYTIYEIHKPWQSHSESNFLIFKIPPKPKEIGKRIAHFGFDNKSDMWKIRGAFDFAPISAEWIKEDGRSQEGSIAINEGKGVVTSRLSSLPILIKPLMLYTIRGFIKNYPEDSKEKNEGFLRVDFYKENGEKEIDKLGISVALSKGVAVNGEWTEVEVSMQAPISSKYLTISLQRKGSLNYTTGNLGGVKFSSLLDDVEVFENENIPSDNSKGLPYIKPTIPIESIYYDSFL